MISPLPNLRPMSLGDLLDATFRLFRNNFLTFIGIAALMQLPFILLQLVLGFAFNQQVATDIFRLADELPGFDPGTDSFGTLPLAGMFAFIGFTLVLALFQAFVILPLINGALANAVSRRFLNQDVGIIGAYNLGAGRIISVIVTNLIVALLGGLVGGVLIGGFVFVIFAISAVLASSGDSGSGALLGVLAFFGTFAALIVLLLLISFVFVRFIFVTQAAVLEGKGPIEALGRSWRLLTGSYWRVLGIVVLIFILLYILVAIPTSIASFAIGLIFSRPEDFVLQQTLSGVISYSTQILVLPFQLVAYTLLYYDLRVRKEGFDMQMMAEQSYNVPATPWQVDRPNG
ncbi:MAG: glycerophosphoryl diester phosphodiesterase membrane domain-containing protein [Chloroflexaceae bacterium]|jgi:hypothetical protein|nr:glycerophosphoryl diester phosphodiesterase membrane domain-containing protein [Chloroflexaceae bacterium]